MAESELLTDRAAERGEWYKPNGTNILGNKEVTPTDNQGERTKPCVLTVVEAPLMAENELLTPSEVALMFRVNPKTVTRWARAGKISAVRTLGGHRRFRASEIRRFLEEVQDLQA